MKLDLSQPDQAHVAERLRESLIAWLISIRPDGRPHAVAVWFVWEGETILIFSQPGKQKLRNILHNANVVVAIDDTKEGEDVITLEGQAQILAPGEASVTLEAYDRKYSEQIKANGWSAESMAADYSEPIRITLTRYRRF